jgi:hypothetical protein
VVFADSRQISRIRRYSGVQQQRSCIFAYGAITHYGSPFQNDSANTQFYNSAERQVPFSSDPTTPTWQHHQALTPRRFRLIPFRSPLLRESLLLSIPWATKMFQFAQFPLPALFYSNRSDTPLQVPGFPIRTSTDQSLVGSSPWLLAATHVLHR